MRERGFWGLGGEVRAADWPLPPLTGTTQGKGRRIAYLFARIFWTFSIVTCRQFGWRAPPLDLHSVFSFFFLVYALLFGSRRVFTKLLPKPFWRKAATCFCWANPSLLFDVFIQMRKCHPHLFFFFFYGKKWRYVITLTAAIVCNPQSPHLPGLILWFSHSGLEQRPRIHESETNIKNLRLIESSCSPELDKMDEQDVEV